MAKSDTEEMRGCVEGLLKHGKPAEFQFRDLNLEFEPADRDSEQDSGSAIICQEGIEYKLAATVRPSEKDRFLPEDFLVAIRKLSGYVYHYEKLPANELYIYENKDEEGNP